MQINTVHNGDALEILRTLPDNSIDSVVTDPPYGISFMAKGWDTFKGNQEYAQWVEQWARECLRILKPGGYLLAFSGTRTYHALAWGVESAGFEIRDMIEWLYLSGFPKSMDVGKQFDKMAGAEREVIAPPPYSRGRTNHRYSETRKVSYDYPVQPITAPATPLAKQWSGWGTALKPAHEPIVMARKPLSGTVCANVEQYGTGAINVDGCRIPADDFTPKERVGATKLMEDRPWQERQKVEGRPTIIEGNDLGRFPANCITTDDDAWYSKYFGIAQGSAVANVTPQEISKKASKKDRNSTWDGKQIEGTNKHPTVKNVDLMSWLIRLVTPPNGIVLDPFAGSGSTLVAAKREGFSYIGIEREQEYIDIIHKRLA